jgi:hypothetical protein
LTKALINALKLALIKRTLIVLLKSAKLAFKPAKPARARNIINVLFVIQTILKILLPLILLNACLDVKWEHMLIFKMELVLNARIRVKNAPVQVIKLVNHVFLTRS